MAKNYEITIDSHLDELDEAMKNQIRIWLSAIGEDGVSVAQEIIDRNHRVQPRWAGRHENGNASLKRDSHGRKTP